MPRGVESVATLRRHMTELMQLVKRAEADPDYTPASLERLRSRLAEAEDALEAERKELR